MKEIFEAILGIFLITLMLVGSLSCISASIDAKNADATKTAYISELENSNYSKEIMTKIFEDAAKRNYQVKLAIYDSHTVKLASSAAELPAETLNVYMVRVDLKFNYTVKLLNIVEPQTVTGYAR